MRIGVERHRNVECPRRSATTLGCTPAMSARVACVCRRSWSRIGGSLAFPISFANRLVMESGWIGLPPTSQKTNPSTSGGYADSEVLLKLCFPVILANTELGAVVKGHRSPASWGLGV